MTAPLPRRHPDLPDIILTGVDHVPRILRKHGAWLRYIISIGTTGNAPDGFSRSRKKKLRLEFDDVEFAFGVGGHDKKNSSSWILTEWKAPKTERIWGYYRVLHEVPGMKVKELTVNPEQALSMQRHKQRSEYWIVEEGRCCVNSMMPNGYLLPAKELSQHDEISIPVNEWHQLINPYDTPCRVVEIQYGARCNEEDIERKS